MVEVLRRQPKRVVFSHGEDARVLRVAAELARLEAVAPILLGNRQAIRSLAKDIGVSLDFIGVVEPVESADFSFFCERYRRGERARRRRVTNPEEVMAMPAYYAGMMLQYGYADGLVGGNEGFPAAFFRALFHIIGRRRESASSCVPVWLPNRPELGWNGTLFLADCAVVPLPTTKQLAETAVDAALMAGWLCGMKPLVAMISFSTRGSARTPATQKVLAAMELARAEAGRRLVDMEIDGELQIDAALDPAAAKRKAPGSPLGGKANVLVFPDLNAAHSAFKLLEVVAGAETCGQQVLGLTRPAAQVSRVATERTILAAALCVAMRSRAYRKMIRDETFS